MNEIKEYWPVIAGFTTVVVWAVRVEMGMKKNASDIRSLWKQRNSDLEASSKAREETNKFLERMENKMDASFKEVRDDIKSLLAYRGGST